MSGLPIGHAAKDFPRLRVTPGLRLLVYRNAIANDLEASASRWKELDIGLRILPANLSRQTGGSGLVASKSAVFDADFHADRVMQCPREVYQMK